MLDLNEICDAPEQLKERLGPRLGDPAVIDRVVELATVRKTLLTDAEEKKRRRNELTRQIATAKEPGERERLRTEARRLGDEIKDAESRLGPCAADLTDQLLMIPNAPHATVPRGVGENENLEVRRWGEPAQPVTNPRPHWETGGPLGLDIERGVKLAGARFYVLKGQLARLEMAIIHFMIDLHTEQHGYELVIPPYMVNAQAMEGCGQLPKFYNELYRTQDELFLVPTAESALAGMHRDEILHGTELPKKYVGFTPCFRREAGAAGRDNRGILRVHQFHKVELFKFTTDEDSYDELEALVADAEAVLQSLELPYRVVLLSAGDMGFAAAKTYDLEVWLPSQNCYREISSCSNVEAFQARRTNTRYRPGPNDKPRFAHMLNGSGLAVGRTLIAILENYQQDDGTVVVPDALRPYLNGLAELTPQEALATA